MLILDGAVDQIADLLRGEGNLRLRLPLVLVLGVARGHGRRPHGAQGHPSSQNGQQAEADLYALPHPFPNGGGSPWPCFSFRVGKQGDYLTRAARKQTGILPALPRVETWYGPLS